MVRPRLCSSPDHKKTRCTCSRHDTRVVVCKSAKGGGSRLSKTFTARILNVIKVQVKVAFSGFRTFQLEEFPRRHGERAAGGQITHARHKFKLSEPAFKTKWCYMAMTH